MSLSARLKHPGAEEHARNPALLFPLCHMPGRFTHCTGVKGEGFWETELKWPLKRACFYFSGLRPNKTLRKSIYLHCSVCVCVSFVQDPAETCIALSVDDMTTVVSAASLTLLRRDMSLNRRLYAWLLGAYYSLLNHVSSYHFYSYCSLC